MTKNTLVRELRNLGWRGFEPYKRVKGNRLYISFRGPKGQQIEYTQNEFTVAGRNGYCGVATATTVAEAEAQLLRDERRWITGY